MRFLSPDRPHICRRLLTVTPARMALAFMLIAVAATAFASTSSSARSLFAKASLMVGGASGSSANLAATNQSFEASAAPTAPDSSTMLTERHGHTATRLADGRVLIAGGANGSGVLNESEIYDPASATFSTAGNLNSARADHSATLLGDGRVLIAGGRDGAGSLNTTEIFNPATGAFTNGPALSVARAGHSATLFADGRILIVGGDASGSAEIFDSALTASSATGALSGARSMHSAALLQDGRVLIVGGQDASGTALNSGEIFDTPAGSFSPVDDVLVLARVRPHLRVLFDGKVQIIGGNNDGSMEIYDPLYEGFGAYAHVIPESDTCAGLPAQVLASQTRAALFHNGQSDAQFDRTGHTITELNGQALIVGGVNSAGAVLGSTSVVASSAAAITTDQTDYSPGDTATITGRGFQPGETVRVKIHEDPHTPQERGFDAVADSAGNFSGTYLVMDYDMDMKFIVGARGLTSGITAQTTFTDARLNIITVGAQSPNPVTPGNAATFPVTVALNGNSGSCSVTLSVIGLPAGAGGSFSPNPVSGSGVVNLGTTLTVTTTLATAGGSHSFTVRGTAGGTCQNAGDVVDAPVTLVVAGGTVATTTSVSNATATYGDSSVTLNATVTPASGPAVNSGSVTFTVKQGPTTIGVATTDNTIVAGAASVSYALPAGTAAGGYTIEASYSGATGFDASSGTGSLTINQKGLTITASNKTKTYGDTVTFDQTTPSTDFSVSGLINSDTVDSITLASGGAAATATVAGSPYAIVASNALGTGLGNYDIQYVDGSLTVDKATLTITASNKTKTYGDTVTFDESTPSTDFSVSGLVNTDTVDSVTLASGGAAATATVAGSPYAITVSNALGTGLTNYDIHYVNGSLTVDKATLTITAANKTKTYGDTVTFDETTPSTDFSVSGLVNTDTVASISLASTGAAATANVAGSPYAIVPSNALGTGLANYDIHYVNGSLTVDQRPLTITASNKTKTYGDTVTFDETTPSTDFTVGAMVNGDTVNSITLTSAGAAAGAPVSGSPYAIVPSAAVGTGVANYNISYVNGTLTVNKALLTITASSHTIIFNDPVPTITPSYTGFVAGDDASDLTTQPTCSTTYTVGSLIGQYPTKCENAASGNYNISYVNGKVTVLTACSAFNGFLSPIGGAVELGTGGVFSNPVRAFKLNSTIPVKFSAMCFGAPLTTGIHTLTAIKYSSAVDSDPAIDATPTDAASIGNQFRFTDGQWIFNLNTKALGGNAQGTWLLKATLFDGSSYTVWVSIKK
jgi:MBG domain-containing protein/Big-like domain-containing protein/galactose oxidase-like protein/Kelch motif protein